ncbi:hypothetical protein TraAM80_07092 [Trypanosoma rangeli]|uniref:Uncharacterized protein n=1 Tax=Trypanosoma rangeli TaxID=5698 RepID=A0A422N772_TRYRA|nr:uncharacterized protein TraAM80_07092 [Trypanosoma rangeli]RNF01295.1 hypothetical protein TraAM80_07092 [Trypanosoma rangeli]|eukprot:RNF01295.1 hypothetical protein TraAM80_07092 [Trypanosoma rangeli]
METLDEAAVDALIREEEERVRQFKLFHCTDDERRREYGAVPKPVSQPPPPPPPRAKLSGSPLEMLSENAEEALVHEYEQYRRGGDEDDINMTLRCKGPPPPNYDGPLLTLTTRGPYTRVEVLACRPPVRPRFDGKKTLEKDRSPYYPRPLREKPKEDNVARPGDSLRRWKYSMGFPDT